MTVVIAAIPRSGSSLTAKIFAAHGLWVGRHEKNNQVKTPVPYYRYENIDVDEWFRTRNGNLERLIDNLKPNGTRLVYKASPIKAVTVAGALHDADLVCCKRKFASIIKSSPVGTEKHRREQLATLEGIDAPVIDVDAVIARDFTTLEAAFRHCKIPFNPEIAEAQIDDSLWHHR